MQAPVNCRIVIEEGPEHDQMDIAVAGLTELLAEHLVAKDNGSAADSATRD
jgi:hypothetical protein